MSAPSKKVTSNSLSRSDQERLPSAPPIVRQLKPPPEIWELVHPVTAEKFKPSRSFLSRLTSSWTILVVLAFAVGVLAGVGAAFWNHPVARSFLYNSQTQTETTAKPVTSEPLAAAPVNNSQAATAPVPSDYTTVANASETTPEAGATQEQTQSEPTRSAPRAPGRRSTSERPAIPTPNAAIGVRVSSPESATGRRPSGSSTERSSTDTASTKAKSSTTENSQVVAPAKPTASPKAKVIQWP